MEKAIKIFWIIVLVLFASAIIVSIMDKIVKSPDFPPSGVYREIVFTIKYVFPYLIITSGIDKIVKMF